MQIKTEDRSTAFLGRLRSQTDVSHKRLEALPLSKILVDTQITVVDYSKYLELMHDVVYQMERVIFPILQSYVCDLEERKKAHLILSDLEVLGHQKSTSSDVFDSAAVSNTGFAMGMLYVLEGSTLGGRFILKNISENLGFDATKGASYFAGYGNKTGSAWKNFLAILTAFEADHEAETDIIKGADYAFQAIEKHLS